MNWWKRCLLAWVLVILLVMPPLSGQAEAGRQFPAGFRQVDPATQKARELLAKMTPEEKVGQLFLVTFYGTNTDSSTQIYDLVVNKHVGGVVLLRENDNFGNNDDLRQQVYQLTSALQRTEWEGAQVDALNPLTGVAFTPQYVPLLIGISQEGDSYPADQILNGLSSLPSLMSIGATWDTTLAEQIGEIMGRELAAEGFNLYIGPALDVLDMPNVGEGGDLGVRTFGGDPYWVSKMGQSYITGLHQGSSNQLAVIAKHFPGRGSSDRSPEEEIATVRKSLDQLKSSDLAPFFAVTGNTTTPDAMADGLLVSHIRYQGFQGNIRATTRPVSLDKTALDLILKLDPFVIWHSNRGLIVSDDLGSQAVRRFYESTGQTYDANQVAREAFYAGNDLLYVNRFTAGGDPDSYTTIVRTLAFFAQRYRSDPEFARRVDLAVERVLAQKFRLYPQFTVDLVIPDQAELSEVGNSDSARQAVMDVARQAITLISPSASELVNVLPQPPGSRSRIVFLTDVMPQMQCSACVQRTAITKTALQSAVLNLYGQRATGQVSAGLMSSYTFGDLWTMLNQTSEDETLQKDLELAEWVVVAMLKPNPAVPESQAFKRLLADQPRLLRDKKVIVFAFDSPYYLDATEISKVTAYYGVYSKIPAFIEMAARVLFRDMEPLGALPVSVPGVGYDLIDATSPDPAQNIALLEDRPWVAGTSTPTPLTTEQPTPTDFPQSYGVGDVISLRTGIIRDHNQNPVPDGTQVIFFIQVITSNGTNQQVYNSQVEQFSMDGVARLSYKIDQAGLIDIRARSGGANSDSVRLDVTRGEAVPTVFAQPTQQPTATPTSTPTLTPTATPTLTPTQPVIIPPATVEFRDWFFMLLVALAFASVMLWMGMQRALARWGLRWGLCGLIGGLVAYNYLAMGLPGSQEILRGWGTQGVLLVTFLGLSIGWLVGLVWKQLTPKGGLADRIPTGERRNAEGRTITGPKSQRD